MTFANRLFSSLCQSMRPILFHVRSLFVSNVSLRGMGCHRPHSPFNRKQTLLHQPQLGPLLGLDYHDTQGQITRSQTLLLPPYVAVVAVADLNQSISPHQISGHRVVPCRLDPFSPGPGSASLTAPETRAAHEQYEPHTPPKAPSSPPYPPPDPGYTCAPRSAPCPTRP